MQPIDKVVLYAALLTSFFNLLGILYNHHLSKRLKTSDKDDEEKREIRRKIQDRLAEFETQALPKFLYIEKIADRLIYEARKARRYDVTLSTMIRDFKTEWKKVASTFSTREPLSESDIACAALLTEHAAFIGDRADNLLASQSVVKRVKIWLSWLRFRISLAKKNWQQK